jgi:K+-transporting ATPase KdpF subunit
MNRFASGSCGIACRCAGSKLRSTHDDGRHHVGLGPCVFCRDRCLRLRVRASLEGLAMAFDYTIAALVTVVLLVYLTYALLRPERF